MAAFFSLTLATSIVGLVTLLTLKRYEMSTGQRIFSRARPRVDRFFGRLLIVIGRGIPFLMRYAMRRVLGVGRERIQQILARAMALFEYHLERTLHIVRQQQAPQGNGTTSEFFKEVAAHKQKLLKRSRKNRAIFEE